MNVVIQGSGVAAAGCRYLLESIGIAVRTEHAERAGVPAIMLGRSSQALLESILKRKNLFSGSPEIRQRIVKWGPDAKPVAVPHLAAVVSEQFLVNQISGGAVPASSSPDKPEGWRILSSPPVPKDFGQYHFGDRTARITGADLRTGCDRDACWIESLDTGWLFLLPAEGKRAWLIGVGNSLPNLMDPSSLIARQITGIHDAGRVFEAHPRITMPLSGAGWLICGSTAIGFDPICGEGTAHAIREAILASAVIRAAARGEDADRLTAHYQARLIAGFRRHLIACCGFYQSGGHGEWWATELSRLTEGIVWCGNELKKHGDFRYRLNEFDLEAIR